MGETMGPTPAEMGLGEGEEPKEVTAEVTAAQEGEVKADEGQELKVPTETALAPEEMTTSVAAPSLEEAPTAPTSQEMPQASHGGSGLVESALPGGGSSFLGEVKDTATGLAQDLEQETGLSALTK